VTANLKLDRLFSCAKADLQQSILWMEGIRNASPKEIIECFDQLEGDTRDLVKSLYCIEETLPEACRRGALDFINDYLFAEPVLSLVRQWREEGRPVFQYVIDEVNPWRQSAGAHHGVDLIYLFGDYELPNPIFEKTGKEMRKRWILFINGIKPWDTTLCAFGPLGICDELGPESVTNRRRWEHLRLIHEIKPSLGRVLGKLVAGRISLRS
jgi:hypothetical protein